MNKLQALLDEIAARRRPRWAWLKATGVLLMYRLGKVIFSVPANIARTRNR